MTAAAAAIVWFFVWWIIKRPKQWWLLHNSIFLPFSNISYTTVFSDDFPPYRTHWEWGRVTMRYMYYLIDSKYNSLMRVVIPWLSVSWYSGWLQYFGSYQEGWSCVKSDFFVCFRFSWALPIEWSGISISMELLKSLFLLSCRVDTCHSKTTIVKISNFRTRLNPNPSHSIPNHGYPLGLFC